MKKINEADLREVPITNMAAEGKCIARINGQVVFVYEAAPGDLADLRITGRKKKFLEARIQNLVKPGASRVVPFCEHFGVCGGCKWQHIRYEDQAQYKRQQVVDALERIGGLKNPEVLEICSAPDTEHYRNKLEFTFTPERWLTHEEIGSGEILPHKNGLGFHIPGRFDKVLDIRHCHLQPEPSNAIRLAVKDYALKNGYTFYNLDTREGWLRNLIIRNNIQGQFMVILQVSSFDELQLNDLLTALQNQFPEITSLNYVVNSKLNETFYDLDVICFSGKPYLEEQMEELTFRIGPKSFFQTNPHQALSLYEFVRDFAGLTGKETVYDLYTGTGTIALFLAKGAKKVVGLEYVEDAITDAKTNAKINGITNDNFFAGDIKDLLTKSFIDEHGKPDVMIADPPRAGMHPDVCRMILQSAPKRLIYVSCNPATQARDLTLLLEKYRYIRSQPVDMFPHTHHVENIALLEIKK